MEKEELIVNIKKSLATPAKGQNSMGNSESYYNPYYLIGRCFTEDELNGFDKDCLNNLVKLGEFASEAFY